MVVRRIATMCLLTLTAALVGCGGNSNLTAKKPSIEFQSPALGANGTVPAGFTCKESKIWLPLRWGALPSRTKEIVIYIARFGAPEIKPGGLASAKLAAQQLIIGVKPTAHHLAVGKLPHGALIGSFEVGNKRQSVCPTRTSASAGILFGLYALPHAQNISKGATQNGNLVNKLQNEAVGYGTFTATYGRGGIVVRGK